jgi:hypothetical protein
LETDQTIRVIVADGLGHGPLAEQTVLAAALRGMFQPILSSESVKLILEETTGIPRIYNDDRKVPQILRNFISNGLKLTTEGSAR